MEGQVRLDWEGKELLFQEAQGVQQVAWEAQVQKKAVLEVQRVAWEV